MRNSKNILNDPYFHLLSFLITSAQGCIDEPPLYGTLRLLDAAQRLIEIMKRKGKITKEIEELEHMIDECIDTLMYDDEKFVKLIDEISKKLGKIIKGN